MEFHEEMNKVIEKFTKMIFKNNEQISVFKWQICSG